MAPFCFFIYVKLSGSICKLKINNIENTTHVIRLNSAQSWIIMISCIGTEKRVKYRRYKQNKFYKQKI